MLKNFFCFYLENVFKNIFLLLPDTKKVFKLILKKAISQGHYSFKNDKSKFWYYTWLTPHEVSEQTTPIPARPTTLPVKSVFLKMKNKDDKEIFSNKQIHFHILFLKLKLLIMS